MAPSDHRPTTQTASERAALSGDVASQSLNEALRVSFRLLKLAMLLVAALFLASGVFTVKQHEQAFVLRFGRIVTHEDPATGKQTPLYGPGLHFAWPFLVDEVVRFPVQRDLSLPVNAFWYMPPPPEPGTTLPQGIAPDMGGYNLTGDANILHSRWVINYSVAAPVKFCEKLADPAELAADKPSGTVRKLLTSILAGTVIRTVARYPVDDAYGGKRGQLQDDVKRSFTAEVKALDAGIEINNVILDVVTPPLQTRRAFDDVTNAGEESGKVIGDAKGYADKTVTEARGAASRVRTEAEAYRTRVVAEAEADASYMSDLLAKHPDDPELLTHFLRQRLTEVRQEFLAAAEEIYVIRSGGKKPGQVRIWLPRDPQAVLENMQRRARERQEQEQKQKAEK